MSPYTPNLPFAPDLGLRDSYAFSVALPTSTESGNQTIGKTDGSEEAKEEHAGEESRAGPGSSYVGDHGGVRGDASASGASSETATVRNVKINRTFAPIFFAFFFIFIFSFGFYFCYCFVRLREKYDRFIALWPFFFLIWTFLSATVGKTSIPGFAHSWLLLFRLIRSLRESVHRSCFYPSRHQ